MTDPWCTCGTRSSRQSGWVAPPEGAAGAWLHAPCGRPSHANWLRVSEPDPPIKVPECNRFVNLIDVSLDDWEDGNKEEEEWDE